MPTATLLQRRSPRSISCCAPFNALLRIGYAESGAARAGFTDVDLAALVHDVDEFYAPVLEERGLHLASNANGAVAIQGDRDLLFQALTNLLDNAMLHATGGEHVSLDLSRRDSRAVIRVADHGPGIPEAERQEVLQRFHRLDTSRASPGSGLGLSLVAAVAKLHGAELALGDNAPGLVVELCFPLQSVG